MSRKMPCKISWFKGSCLVAFLLLQASSPVFADRSSSHGQRRLRSSEASRLGQGAKTAKRSCSPRLRRSPSKPARPPVVSAEQAMSLVRSGNRVLLPAEVGASQMLVDALVQRANQLRGKKPIEVVHPASLLERASHATADPSKLQVNSLFINSTLRPHVGSFQITPAYLGEIPGLLKSSLKPDVVFIKVSTPDKHGYVSMGPGADVVTDLLASRGVKVIAEMNPNVPRTRGDSRLHVSHIDRLVSTNAPLQEHVFAADDPVAQAIGRNVAKLVPNGATLQLGIGELQEAVAHKLVDHGKAINDRGRRFRVSIWTEIAANGVKDLADAGLISKRRDSIKMGFALGDRAFYDFLSRDKRVKLVSTAVINDPMIAGEQKKLVAVNSGLAVDLWGQACSEMVPRKDSNGKIVPSAYSGVGGQVDFFRAAQRSPGGKGVLTLRSTAKKGTISAITLDLPPGVVVTTNRYDMDYVATEWGVAKLRGKTVVERAMALTRIAHPKFREELARQGQERFGGSTKAWTEATRTRSEEQHLLAQLEQDISPGQ